MFERFLKRFRSCPSLVQRETKVFVELVDLAAVVFPIDQRTHNNAKKVWLEIL